MLYSRNQCSLFIYFTPLSGDLLRINDELNNLFLRYDRYEKKRTTILSALESKPQAIPAMPVEVC